MTYGGESYPERYLASTGKGDSPSLQQMATCAGRKKRWCLVFSRMYVSPLLSAAFILKGGIYLPRLLAVSVFLCV